MSIRFVNSGISGDAGIFRAKRNSDNYHLSGAAWQSAGPADNSMTWDDDLSAFYFDVTVLDDSFGYMMSSDSGILRIGEWQIMDALSGYESTGVASKTDVSGVINVEASAVASAVSGAVVSGIGAWGDLRWSKIYGIPLDEWDIIVGPLP